MLQKSSMVRVVDSSGVAAGRTIQVFRGFEPVSRIGGMIRISIRYIKRLHPRLKIKACRRKKILFTKKRRRATVVRTKFGIVYSDGRVVKFLDNAVVLWKRINVFCGRRFYGISSSEVRHYAVLHRFNMVI